MSAIIDGLLICWNNNLDYGQRLVADLTEEQMVLQPVPDGKSPANHAAWVMSHLNAYLPILPCLIKGVTFDDPKDHPFGMKSRPESDRNLYPSKQEMIETFVAGHEVVTELLSGTDDSVFDKPVMLERWQSRMPTAGAALMYLMVFHENVHLGQLSAWRRIQGMPSV